MTAKGVVSAMGLMAGVMLSPASSAQSAAPVGLSSLEPGEWELVERGKGQSTRRLCISDGSQLLQPQHPHRQCKRYVIRQTSREVAASYECAEGSRGRTDLRIETPRLVQISSQGVSDGLPFSLALEGRHVGTCRSAALRR